MLEHWYNSVFSNVNILLISFLNDTLNSIRYGFHYFLHGTREHTTPKC